MTIPDQTDIYGKTLSVKSEREVTLKEPFVKGFIYPLKPAPGNGIFSKASGLNLIKTMLKIQKGFDNIEQKHLKPHDIAIWTMMSLISEFDFQSQEQGKLVHRDEPIGDIMADFIQNVESDPGFKATAEDFAKISKAYNMSVPNEETGKSGTNED